MKKINKQKAVFIDRDGVLIEHVHHLSKLKDVKLINSATDAVRVLNKANFLTIIVTNQSVVGRGLISLTKLNQIHTKIELLFKINEAYFDAIYYCPHFPNKSLAKKINEFTTPCQCRKPETLLIDQAVNDFNIDLENSYFIGDSSTDLLAAKKKRISSILVKTGVAGKDNIVQNIKPDIYADNIYQAVQHIIRS